MDKEDIKTAVEKVKSLSPKRNFKQTFDLIINTKGLDLKKTDQQVEFFANLHNTIGRPRKICAFVGPELIEQAEKVCDKAILVDDFPKYDKKAAKKLAKEFDYFIAQATIMPKVAQAFGKVLGTRGKMPNPKAGCVVPPNANLKQLYDRLQKIVKVSIKQRPMVQVAIGKEDMDEAQLIDNIETLYDQVIHHLPQEKNNIKDVYLKLTMGRPVKIGEKSDNNVQAKKSNKKSVDAAQSTKEEGE